MVVFFIIWFFLNLIAIFGGGIAVHETGEFIPGGIFCVGGIVSMIIELCCLGIDVSDGIDFIDFGNLGD